MLQNLWFKNVSFGPKFWKNATMSYIVHVLIQGFNFECWIFLWKLGLVQRWWHFKMVSNFFKQSTCVIIDNHKLNYKVAYLMFVLGPLLKFYLQLYPLCCEPNTRLLIIVLCFYCCHLNVHEVHKGERSFQSGNENGKSTRFGQFEQKNKLQTYMKKS